MVKKVPKFSVLLPTKERLDLLMQAVETVRMQSYDDWEIIVSDNASQADIRGYVDGLGDARVKYIRCDDPVPVTDNWNNAYEASSGQYVVMLGDDDGLVPDYFSRCEAYMEQLEQPDFLYHSAYHFAFLDVFPDQPQGFLQDVTPSYQIFDGHNAPYILDQGEAHDLAKAALDMRMLYGFNMQYFLFRRDFLEKLKGYGAVFQGPYPDFYAGNLSLLIAERIGVVPFPMTVIGISPKSHGFYHFNDDEGTALSFLDNDEYGHDAVPGLVEKLLPGDVLNTQWFVSVAYVAHYLKDNVVRLGVGRYRILQIMNSVVKPLALRRDLKSSLDLIWPMLSLSERIVLVLCVFIAAPLAILPKGVNKYYARALLSLPRQYRTFRRYFVQGVSRLAARVSGMDYTNPSAPLWIGEGQDSVVDVYDLLSRVYGMKSGAKKQKVPLKVVAKKTSKKAS